MPLVFGAICPHPPILIPKIGAQNLNKVQKTIQALLKLEKELVKTKPETIVVISPHGQLDSERFNILGAKKLYGNFGQFGNPETEMLFKNDSDLILEIQKKSKKNNLSINIVNISNLDHGLLVPLFYLSSGKLDNLPIVSIGFSLLSYDKQYKFGKMLGEVFSKSKKRIALIASGDLSHRLTIDAPAGYSPNGKNFDKKIIDLLEKNSVEEVLKIAPAFAEEAGECGLRSIIILLGTLSILNYQPEISSYEGPFGVGYLVANFKINNNFNT